MLCTASTLVNDTLDELLATLAATTRFELIGPSGSGPPDPLFARGVGVVGGIRFVDQAKLLATLDRGDFWRAAGRKRQLDPRSYPGIGGLIERL